jgi:predicted secreted Zn-dependent protease
LKAFFILYLLLISSIAYAEPTINTRFDFYDIFPSTKNDLGREMENRSPIEEDGITFIGHTDWQVKWNFKWKKKNKMCNITKVRTSLKVTYTMPQIAKDHEVSQSVRQSFADYYNSLLNHEKGHMSSGLYAARDIEKALLSLGSFKSCDTLEETANATGDRIIKKYNKRDIEYDINTNHGETEGVSIDNFIY